ncbi:unnamed protein product [[Actinomadura] parvosata subsp. kistnae]|uniref:DUF3224 domain-containing protein n=1 Tax=Nonomuraea composti TaxID=2720023 RepID=A0ABX1BE33_9ACTN|nr:DUF3224 domain-containing protein [Nonomuraea sp. FMUSA5-5]NJP96039.1 DUF3224 domain-containing protein [Nonomuraea sp. FMUSA5-5]SPL88281.1 unnamed protein product [Actinomadura parvosata subsp. kistnae]
MTFTWGGLTPGHAAVEEAQPPDHAVTHTSTVEVVGYDKQDIGPAAEGYEVVATLLTERFSGGIEGMGYADHIRVFRPDGTQIAAGVERVIGSVGGRTGSFVLTSHAQDDGSNAVRGVWTVVPGSGTGELAGLRGRGEFTARVQPDGSWRAEDNFTYWFD